MKEENVKRLLNNKPFIYFGDKVIEMGNENARDAKEHFLAKF